MKILRILLYLVIALVALVIILSFVAPNDITLERSVSIDAPAEVVFDHAVNFEKNKEWSPWMKLDPNMKSELIGPDGKVGTVYKWESEVENVGHGEQSITKIEPNQRIDTHLKFIKPWESEADAYITLAEDAGKTNTTWGFHTKAAFPMDIMMMVMNVDKVLGADYEKGLASLKAVAEADAKNRSKAMKIQTLEIPARYFVAIKETIQMDKVAERYAINLPKVLEAVNKSGNKAAGMPCGLFYSWDEKTGMAELAHAIPVAQKIAIKGFETIELPAGKNLLIDYYGDYNGTEKAHIALDKYAQVNNLELIMPVIEQYETDPGDEPDPNKWLTKIFYPIK